MAVPVLPLLILVVAGLIVAAFWRSGLGRHRTPGPRDPSRRFRRVARWGMGGLGIVAAVFAALALGQRAIFLVVPLAVSGYLAGVLLAELIMPGPATGAVRHGSLEPRKVGRYLGPVWVSVWRFAAGGAVAAIGAAGLLGASDGRSLTLSCANGTSSTASPWPGWSFGGPALAVLLIGVVLVEISMRRTVERGRPDPDVLDMATDEANRAAALLRSAASGMAIALIPLAGVALSAAAILGFVCPPDGTLSWTAPSAIALVILGSAAGLGALAALIFLVMFSENDVSTLRGDSRNVQLWN